MRIKIYHYSKEGSWKIPSERWEIDVSDDEIIRIIKAIFDGAEKCR